VLVPKFPESHSAREGGACNNWIRVAQMAAHYCDFTSAIRLEHRSSIFGEWGPTQAPKNCMHAAPGTHT